MLIVGLENERAKLVAVRAERLKLWEQRHQLTRELTTKTFDQFNKPNVIIPAVSGVAPLSSFSPVRDRKGVRADKAELQADNLKQWSSFG